MTDYRQDPRHYLAASDFIRVGPKTTVSEVLRQVSTNRTAAILVVEDDRPTRLVQAKRLGEEAIRITLGEDPTAKKAWASLEPKRTPFEVGLQEFLSWGRWQSQQPVEVVVELSSRRVPVRASQEVANSIPLGKTAAPRDVYAVFDGDQLSGLLFSHESYKAGIATPPPTYKCVRGHINRDPDNGRCSKCPGKLNEVT